MADAADENSIPTITCWSRLMNSPNKSINDTLRTCSDAADKRNGDDPVRITRSLGVSGQAHDDEAGS